MAIKALKTLIRLQKRELDALRRQIVALQQEKQNCIDAIKRMDEEFASEQERAASMPEMAVFFGSFAQAIRSRQESMRVEITKIDKKVDELADQVAEKFGDQKKYEIIHDRMRESRNKEQLRKEIAELDEVALTQYVRDAREEG